MPFRRFSSFSGGCPSNFDNKNEFQIVVDIPEGTTLETTSQVVQAYENFLETVPEVTVFVSYAGIPSPFDFNGLVRHYYLRTGANMADIRVNLLHKDERDMQSHAILLRLRADLTAIARKYGAALKLVEVPPPGPPVLATVTAEIYCYSDDLFRPLPRAL